MISKLSGLTNCIGISAGEAVFQIWIKQSKYFDQQLKNCLPYINSNTIFLVSWMIYYKKHLIIVKKDTDHFEIEHKTCSFLVTGAVTP